MQDTLFPMADEPEFTIIPPSISTREYRTLQPSKKAVSFNGWINGTIANNAEAGPSRIRPQQGYATPPFLPGSLGGTYDSFLDGGAGADTPQMRLEEAQILKSAREQIRSYTCRIKTGDGHVERHVQTMIDMHQDRTQNRTGDDDNYFLQYQYQPRYKCPWGNCKYDGYDIDELGRHIEVDHLQVGLRCPYKGCNERLYKQIVGYGLSTTTLHTQDTRKHPGPWSGSLSNPKLFMKLRPHAPPPLPNITLPAYTISHLPVLPRTKSLPKTRTPSPPSRPIPSIPRYIFDESPPPPTSQSRGRTPSQLTFRKLKGPILPFRDEDEVPFFPSCGEAISYDSTGTFSGSIFPSTVPSEGDEGREKDGLGRFIVPSASEDGGMQLTVRKKLPANNGKVGLGRPRLGVSADVFEWHRKQRELAVKKQKMKDRKGKGKGKEVDLDKMEMDVQNDNTLIEGQKEEEKTMTKWHPDLIRSSALRYATRKTKRSVGVETWKQVIRFENEGRYWGEL
uniref:Uncharacterized protein n=1 Tax=Kwoniella bestiolae CBS 10118 TaxID=1296100 RepID=A0A1B9G5L2_9TREE|nr:hypothetical protein I302_03971 [Kwoniella bestiolae CBS 10118]OCF26288.1 hypothetical protein I302_03971 [Kwoniella bestiolae CBS 10118]